jgi:anti-sigma regulatory factor (Ser/Thr protein kinase)
MGTSPIITQDELRDHASLEVHTVGFREFTPTRDCVREVRHFVKETLGRVGLDKEDVFEVQLIADELAANAVLHAHSVFSVAIELTEDLVRIAVRDDSNDPPVPQQTARDEHGRGLVIVSGTASGWGSASLGRGKEIWADHSRKSA